MKNDNQTNSDTKNKRRKRRKTNKSSFSELKLKQIEFLGHYYETLGHIRLACQRTGISRDTYYGWIKDPKFEEAIIRHNESIGLDVTQSAMIKVCKLMNSPDEKISLKAAMFVLDRTGGRVGFIQQQEQREIGPDYVVLRPEEEIALYGRTSQKVIEVESEEIKDNATKKTEKKKR